MKLIFVRYENEAERKKVEYLISKYSARRVKDVVIEVSDTNFDEFVKELYGKIPEERMKVISGTEQKVHINRIKEEIGMDFSTNKENLIQFLNYLIVRRRGVYRGPLGGFERYRLHTKKGLVDMSIRFVDDNGNTKIQVIIEGKENATGIVKEEMKKELENYRDSLGGN